MQSHTQPTVDIPKWSALLVDAVNKPGLIMEAYSAFHNYSIGNQILALVQCQLRGLEPGRPRKPASVNRELAILSGVFTMAVDYEEIAQNPCRKVEALPENNQRTRHLSFDEEDRLFAALTGGRQHLRTLVLVAIYSGPRRGELLKLRWANVDFDLNAVNFTETKTNKDRSVPMEPVVQEALRDLYEQAGDAEYVFTNPDTGTRYTDIKKSFSAACREAGITNFHLS